jgi:LacI family transcriptional regulator
MATTLQDIAEKAGISVSTVSRVLNGQARKYRISRATERLAMQAAEELNYRPNPLARGLKLKKTHTLGLVVPDISNPFFATIVKYIQKVAHRMEYSVMVCDTDENVALEIEHIELLASKSVDGLIVLPVGQSFDHFRDVIRGGLPLVMLDRSPEDFPADSVVVDNYQGAYRATEHLLAHGHRHIAVIQGLQGTFTNVGRLSGFTDALNHHGVPVDQQVVVGHDFRRETAYLETKLLLTREPRPTALFAFGDLLTFGAMQAIREEGLSIPEDISLITFDDIDFAPFLKCPLTSVAQPRQIMGEMAIKLLEERMRLGNEAPPRRIVLQPTLIERQSVREIGVLAA